MPLANENKAAADGPAGGFAPAGTAPVGANAGGEVSPNSAAAPAAGATALAVRENEANEASSDSREEDFRLERLPMQVDVMVKVRSFRVQDLLSMQKGTVLETVQEHTQDVPVRCGGALLLWSEFEVLDQKLAVRVTRLA